MKENKHLSKRFRVTYFFAYLFSPLVFIGFAFPHLDICMMGSCSGSMEEAIWYGSIAFVCYIVFLRLLKITTVSAATGNKVHWWREVWRVY